MLPASIWLKQVFKAVMKPAGLALPEFQTIGDNAEAAPEGRPGNFAAGELLLQLRKFCFQQTASRNDGALLRHPGAQLASSRTRGEVRHGFQCRNFFGSSLDRQLSLKRQPLEEQCDSRILADVLRLAAFQIREEDEAVAVVRLQKHGS